MSVALFDLLDRGIAILGLTDLPKGLNEALIGYLELLIRWNQAYNLTALHDLEEMVIKHLLDSLSVLPNLTPGRLLDVGSGAGLPAVPIALARPWFSVTALDSNHKKIRFIRQSILSLKIPNLDAVCARTEEHTPTVLYDTIVSRAFSSLFNFVYKTKHLLAPKGVWLAMKGTYPTVELEELLNREPSIKYEVIPIFGLGVERCLVRLQQ